MSRITEELAAIRADVAAVRRRAPMGVEAAAKRIGVSAEEFRLLLGRRGFTMGVARLVPGELVEALRLELALANQEPARPYTPAPRQRPRETRTASAPAARAPAPGLAASVTSSAQLRAAGIRTAGDEALELAAAAAGPPPDSAEALIARLVRVSRLRAGSSAPDRRAAEASDGGPARAVQTAAKPADVQVLVQQVAAHSTLRRRIA